MNARERAAKRRIQASADAWNDAKQTRENETLAEQAIRESTGWLSSPGYAQGALTE